MSAPVLPRHGLQLHGISPVGRVFWNPTVPVLYEEAVRRREGILAEGGPLVCRTGPHTGRSPNDKLIVREPSSEQRIWWGKVNRPIQPEQFDVLHGDLLAYLAGRDLFVQDCHAAADPAYRLPIRILTELAWHSLFARNMFLLEPEPKIQAGHEPVVTVIDVPGFRADPRRHGTNSDTFILIHFGRGLVLIGGTSYAGEIKKSIFTVLNYLLPLRNVLSMHCSANVGGAGDVALFFGLSGTGKTTLSSDPERRLIGDDEHGWSDAGVFNFEGGCYAKTIRLSAEAEPQIHATTRRFGTVLENVTVDDERRLNLDDDSVTENTRGAYPIHFIENVVASGRADHPRHIVMLAADAFGVLPPVARLTTPGAIYHFLSGYTARVAGTERGITEPAATFSTCFGAPFMALPPQVYATFLGERIRQHGVKVWLVNTGWTGGPYGVGRRMEIAHTRSMIRAIVGDALDGAGFETDPIFQVAVPLQCPAVPSELLRPRATWSDPSAYDVQARKVARMFVENFEPFEHAVEADVRAAGPRP